MSLYGGIDLHANNRVVVLLNDQDQVLYEKRLSTQKRHLVGLKRDIRLLCGFLSAAASYYALLDS